MARKRHKPRKTDLRIVNEALERIDSAIQGKISGVNIVISAFRREPAPRLALMRVEHERWSLKINRAFALVTRTGNARWELLWGPRGLPEVIQHMIGLRKHLLTMTTEEFALRVEKPLSSRNYESLYEELLGGPIVFRRRVGEAELALPKGAIVPRILYGLVQNDPLERTIEVYSTARHRGSGFGSTNPYKWTLLTSAHRWVPDHDPALLTAACWVTVQSPT